MLLLLLKLLPLLVLQLLLPPVARCLVAAVAGARFLLLVQPLPPGTAAACHGRALALCVFAYVCTTTDGLCHRPTPSLIRLGLTRTSLDRKLI